MLVLYRIRYVYAYAYCLSAGRASGASVPKRCLPQWCVRILYGNSLCKRIRLLFVCGSCLRGICVETVFPLMVRPHFVKNSLSKRIRLLFDCGWCLSGASVPNRCLSMLRAYFVKNSICKRIRLLFCLRVVPQVYLCLSGASLHGACVLLKYNSLCKRIRLFFVCGSCLRCICA